jgi:hypothetical protein
VRFGSGHAADQVQHLRALDAVELGPELEGAQRVEIRAAVDLAVDAGERGVKQTKRHARRAQQAFDDLGAGREPVAQRDQAFDRPSLVRALKQARARVVFGQDGLEVAMEDEGAIGGAEQLARQRDGARQAIVKRRERRAQIERHDGGAARRAGVIARVREAGGRLEPHLELEQRFVAALELELGQPALALGALLAL